MHELMAATLDTVVGEIQRIKADARRDGFTRAPALADDRAAHAQGLDLPEGDRRQADRGLLALAPGADGRDAREPGARAHPRRVDEELPARGALRRRAAGCGPSWPTSRPRATRRMSANPHANGGLLLRDLRLPDFRDYAVEVPAPGAVDGRVDPGHGRVPARRDEAEPGGAELPAVQPGREQLEPLAGRARGHQPRLGGGDLSVRRPPRPRRAGDGDAERAPVPGLARGLSADRPARLLLLLRGVHPHHRLDVQPARQVAEGLQRHPLAAADRLAELPAVQPRLAAGPQRLQPPGPRLHRPRRQQEGRGRPRLPAARRQLPALGHRPLPAQPQLRQRRRRRQAAGAAVADDGRGDQALRRRARHLGVGEQRPGRASPTW